MEENSRQAVYITGNPLIPDDNPLSDDTELLNSTIIKQTELPDYEESQENAHHFRNAHNRRYHAFEEGQYWLPNDNEEQRRLAVQHYCWKLSMGGGLHLSPVTKETKQVLDIGTGPALWAIEFAEAYPTVQVLGTDLSPIQPKIGVPANCKFEIQNAEAEWKFPHKFDMIHARTLVLGIHDWPRFFKNAWDNLEPGGWLEIAEPEFPFKSCDPSVSIKNSALLRLTSLVYDACAKDGIDTMAAHKYRAMLEAQGFVNIVQEPSQWPLGTWPKGHAEKLHGKVFLPDFQAFIRAISQALFTKSLGWTSEQADELAAEAIEDAADSSKLLYGQVYIYSAQKPRV